uniref:Uncharacterized protein n=1 Tax=Tetranychus urticae TaxID=32264 RepID=T1KI64_TETUR
MVIQLLKIIYTLLVVGNVSMVKSVSGVPRVVKIDPSRYPILP